MKLALQSFTGHNFNTIKTQKTTYQNRNRPHSFTHCQHPTWFKMSFYSSFKIMYYTFYALFLHRIGLILLKKSLLGNQQLYLCALQTWSCSKKSNSVPYADPVKCLMTFFLWHTFSMQLYYIHKESKPTCCTILLLFVVTPPACFSQIYWPSSDIHMQWCFNLELSQILLCLQLLKLLISGS